MSAAAAAGQLILAVQLQRHIARTGNGHSVLVCIPCIHLQVTKDDRQKIGRIIDDLYHISGSVLSLFGKGDGGVGVPVGLLLSGLFLPGLLLRSRLGGRLCGLLLGLGVILAVLNYLIGGLFGLFGLFRLLRVGGLLLVLLFLVLLLLVLRGQQLQRAGLFGLLLVLSGGVLGLPLALGLGLAGLFNLGGFSSAAFRLSVGAGLVLSPVMVTSLPSLPSLKSFVLSAPPTMMVTFALPLSSACVISTSPSTLDISMLKPAEAGIAAADTAMLSASTAAAVRFIVFRNRIIFFPPFRGFCFFFFSPPPLSV